MNELIERSKLFLEEKKMTESFVDFDSQIESFISEMDAGLCGYKSSISMLPSYIKEPEKPFAGRRLLALDAGGTNLRLAAIEFCQSGQAILSNFRSIPMPAAESAPDIAAFFRYIANLMRPVTDYGEAIGFCFSFPFESLPDGEGRIIALNKELSLPGIEGTLVGERLNAALASTGSSKKRIVVINDSVATLLGGTSPHKNGEFSDLISLVLGTGTNMCYFKKITEIQKLNCSEFAGRMAVNLESGGYDRFPRGHFDMELDEASAVPGDHKFEKMVSGKYLGELILRALKGMSAVGIFSDECADRLLCLTKLDTKSADAFIGGCIGVLDDVFVTDYDRAAAKYAASALFERAAKLSSITLSALIKAQSKDANRGLPICVSAEGSMWRHSTVFRSFLHKKLDPYLRNRGLSCKFIVTENVALIGAARAAATFL